MKNLRKFLIPAVAVGLIISANVNNKTRKVSSSFATSEEARRACFDDRIPTAKKRLGWKRNKEIDLDQPIPFIHCSRDSNSRVWVMREFSLRLAPRSKYNTPPSGITYLEITSHSRFTDDGYQFWIHRPEEERFYFSIEERRGSGSDMKYLKHFFYR